MILTDYYYFYKNEGTATRIDCLSSTGSYPALEHYRNKEGRLSLYIGENQQIKRGSKRQADLALSKTKHITGIFTPNIELPFGYGDINNTSDAVIIAFEDFSMINGKVCTGSKIEIFVARGYRHNSLSLYHSLCDGELDIEMSLLRLASKDE